MPVIETVFPVTWAYEYTKDRLFNSCTHNRNVYLIRAKSEKKTRYIVLNPKDTQQDHVGWLREDLMLPLDLDPNYDYAATLTVYRKENRAVVTNILIPTNHKYAATAVPPKKGNTMNSAHLLQLNQTAAISASFLEAGRIVNDQLIKAITPRLPIMMRGYADTPVGKLVLANIAAAAAAQFRPNDANLAKLTTAMTTQAYAEGLASFNIDGLIDDFLKSPEVKNALDKVAKNADPTEPARAE